MEISVTKKISIGKKKRPLIIAEIGINHKEYAHTSKLSVDNIKALSADFI